MLTKQMIARVLLTFRKWKVDGAPDTTHNGICQILGLFATASDAVLVNMVGELEKAFRSWPDYSGNVDFPVPAWRGVYAGCPKGAQQAYFSCYRAHSLWSRDTIYGQLRWELLDHCIAHFQKLYDTTEV